MTIDESNIPLGAGIIIIKEFSQRWKVLALVCYDGSFDIPKGGLDKDETPLMAALRETEEEACITQIDFKWGMQQFVNSKLTCYLATTDQAPLIKKNPHTNIFEHTATLWLSWEDMINGTKSYLKPCIIWAQGVVEGV